MDRSPPFAAPRLRWIVPMLGALALAPAASDAADHLDGERLMNLSNPFRSLDINDVYAFRGANRSNTVLIMTLSPAAGLLGPTAFNLFGVYEFKVDNTGDAVEDLTIRFLFSDLDARGRQSFQYVVTDASGNVLLTGQGANGRNNPVPGGGQVTAGLFDDPFFFDLLTFNRFKAARLANPPVDLGTAAGFFNKRGVTNIPNNFFGGFNVLAIVVEVPSARLQSSRGNRDIAVWARTELLGSQVDRMGRPGINTVLIPDAFKNAFNSNIPSLDSAFRPVAAAELALLFGDSAFARKAAEMLLPDVLTFETGNTGGFLNGRRLEDDVIDAELDLLTQGAVKTDSVVNDSVFRSSFPYLGTPNPKSVQLKAMKALAAKAGGG